VHEDKDKQKDIKSLLKEKKQHMQSGYNPAHAVENGSTISSHENLSN